VCSNDAYLLEKNKPRPVPTSITHAPLPTQQFGVDLELLVHCAIFLLLTLFVNNNNNNNNNNYTVFVTYLLL